MAANRLAILANKVFLMIDPHLLVGLRLIDCLELADPPQRDRKFHPLERSTFGPTHREPQNAPASSELGQKDVST
jgi:hypothetical protein